MALWQLDLVGGIYLADGRECKMLSGIDDHSRFVVCAAVLAVPSGRAVADAFTAAMSVYGVPSEVLTDNGKQFTGRFTKPRPAEVLFERVCREHGITAKLTKPYSPTTTGKVERWHQTLRRELLDAAGPFADLPSAAGRDQRLGARLQPRPAAPGAGHGDAGEPVPARRPPGPWCSPRRGAPGNQAAAASSRNRHDGRQRRRAGPAAARRPVRSSSTPSSRQRRARGLPSVQRIKMGPAAAGRRAHVWADEFTVHVLIGGQLVKTVPSNLGAEDLARSEDARRAPRPDRRPPPHPWPAPAPSRRPP